MISIEEKRAELARQARMWCEYAIISAEAAATVPNRNEFFTKSMNGELRQLKSIITQLSRTLPEKG